MKKKPAPTTNDAVAKSLLRGKDIDAAFRQAVRRAVAANPKSNLTPPKKRGKVRAA